MDETVYDLENNEPKLPYWDIKKTGEQEFHTIRVGHQGAGGNEHRFPQHFPDNLDRLFTKIGAKSGIFIS